MWILFPPSRCVSPISPGVCQSPPALWSSWLVWNWLTTAPTFTFIPGHHPTERVSYASILYQLIAHGVLFEEPKPIGGPGFPASGRYQSPNNRISWQQLSPYRLNIWRKCFSKSVRRSPMFATMAKLTHIRTPCPNLTHTCPGHTEKSNPEFSSVRSHSGWKLWLFFISF